MASLTRTVLHESKDGVMRSALVVIDGQSYNEWECLSCGEIGRAPSITNPRGSQWESQWLLSWIRQHYPYHDNHVSLEFWYETIESAIFAANNSNTDVPRDDFGDPFIACFNTPCREEIAYAESKGIIIDTAGREVEVSDTIFRWTPPAPPQTNRRTASMTTTPMSSVTFHDVDADTYARLLEVLNGPSTVKEKKGKAEKETEPSNAEKFEADADGGDEPLAEKTIYTEKQLDKLVEKKDRDKLAEIAADVWGLDTKSKRAPGLRDMILAAQTEYAESQAAADAGEDEGSGDSDDYKEDAPSKKSKKSAKSEKGGKDKKKKGKKS